MLHREFDRGDSKAKVKYWACAREKHSEGEGTFHYYCALLLSDPKRWGSIADSIYQIRVNFSDGNEEHDANYIAAYRYLSKEDEHLCHSDDHSNLEEAKSPATKYCIAANRKRQLSKVSKSMGKKGLMTLKDRVKRVKFCRDVKSLKCGVLNFWKKYISMYVDGVGFEFKTKPLDQARAPSAREWQLKLEGLSHNEGKKRGCTQC